MEEKNINKGKDIKKESKYTKEELDALRDFVELVKNDEKRAILACWGNHSEYCKGY